MERIVLQIFGGRESPESRPRPVIHRETKGIPALSIGSNAENRKDINIRLREHLPVQLPLGECRVSPSLAFGDLLRGARGAVLFYEEHFAKSSHVQEERRIGRANQFRSFADEGVEAEPPFGLSFVFVDDVPFVDPSIDRDVCERSRAIERDMCFSDCDPMGDMVLNRCESRCEQDPLIIEMPGQHFITQCRGEIDRGRHSAVRGTEEHLLPIDQSGIYEQLEPSAGDTAADVGLEAQPLNLRPTEDVILGQSRKNCDIAVCDHLRTSGKKRCRSTLKNQGTSATQSPEVGRHYNQATVLQRS